MSTRSIKLQARTETPYGVADVRLYSGMVALGLGTESARMNFHIDLSPACARELAAALLDQADAADRDEQKGGKA